MYLHLPKLGLFSFAGSLISSIAGLSIALLRAPDGDPSYGLLAGWLLGGYLGTLTFQLRDRPGAAPAIGYWAGVALAAATIPAILAVAERSLYSARMATWLVPLPMVLPHFAAAVALAMAAPDPPGAFGLVLDPERLGKRRITAPLVGWLVFPLLCLLAIVWGVSHEPGDELGRPYGPGSRACKASAECHVLTSCEQCGQCYSAEPVLLDDCAAVCERAQFRDCECVEGVCTSVAKKPR